MTAPAVTRPKAGTVIEVPVTQDHIDRGRAEDACGNAIALAITDVMLALDLVPAVDSVSVMYADGDYDADRLDARVWIEPGEWLRLVIGPDGRDLLAAIDNYEPVQPCTLTAKVA